MEKKSFNLMEMVRSGLGNEAEIDLTTEPEIEPVNLNGDFPQMEFPAEKPVQKVSLTETKPVKQAKEEADEPEETDEPEKTNLSASKGAKAGVLVLDMLNSTVASIIGKKPRSNYKWERGEKKELEEALKIYIESSDFQVSPGWALFLVLATMIGGTMSEAYQDLQEAKGAPVKRDEPEPIQQIERPAFQPQQRQTRIIEQPERVEKKPFKMTGKNAESKQEVIEEAFFKLKKRSETRPKIKDVFEEIGGAVSMTTVSKYIKDL